MIIDCISDLHGHYPQLEGGDLLIVAGDWTATDKPGEVIQFALWVNEQKYKRKIVIAGNHDNMIQKHPRILEGLPDFVMTYLCDSGTEFEGLKIWGSPWTLRFEGMNPLCKAFTCETEKELAEKWALIPDDTDILVTHGPPKYVLDVIPASWIDPQPDDIPGIYYLGRMIAPGRNAGSKSLSKALAKLKLKLHVFGHIHESYGDFNNGQTKFVNASHVNERYQPVNKPIRIEL